MVQNPFCALSTFKTLSYDLQAPHEGPSKHYLITLKINEMNRALGHLCAHIG